MAVPAVIFATNNAHKLEEVRAILAGLIEGLNPELIGSATELNLSEPVEDGVSFEDNALIKAHHIADRLGLPAFADDSGICVDVLGGAPGIFSARWAGRHGDDAGNLDLLLNQLADVPERHRRAHFVCAAALVVPDSGQHQFHEYVQQGAVSGTLRYERSGEGGFGYDPIFQADGYNVTLAEIPAQEKNSISHRRKAFEALAPQIAAVLGL